MFGVEGFKSSSYGTAGKLGGNRELTSAYGSHITPYGYDDGGQCTANSELLIGLFRSIGVDAQLRYFWNGTQDIRYDYLTADNINPNFQVRARAEDRVHENPHFRFHAVVYSNWTNYDPSYGISGFQELDIMETVSVVAPHHLLTGTDAKQNMQTQLDNLPMLVVQTGVHCAHTD